MQCHRFYRAVACSNHAEAFLSQHTYVNYYSCRLLRLASLSITPTMRRATTSILRSGLRRQRYSHGLSKDSVNPPVQITTLPNKIRVATESTPGHFSSVGLYVDAGSRYETPSTSGVSHFLDRMAFKVNCLACGLTYVLMSLSSRRQQACVRTQICLRRLTSLAARSSARPHASQ